MRIVFFVLIIMSAFVVCADESSEQARYQLVREISKKSDAHSLKKLEGMLEDPSMMIRHASAGVIADIGGRDAENIFQHLMKSENVENRRIASIGLAKVYCSNDSFYLILHALKDPSWQVRWAACFGLGLLGDLRAIEDLKQIKDHDSYQQDSYYPVRKVATDAIKKIQESVRWYGSFDNTIKESTQAKKIIVFVVLKGSYWSQKMIEEVFSDPELIELSRHYRMIKIRPDQFQKSFDHIQVQGVPTLFFFDQAYHLLDQVNGYIEAEPLKIRMEKNRIDIGEREQRWQHVKLYLETDQYSEALKHLETIQESEWINDKERDLGLFYLGYLYGKLEQHQEAVRHFEELNRMNSDFYMIVKAKYCLALSYLALGNVKKSKRLFHDLEHDPELKDVVQLILRQIKLKEKRV